jgi:hypothetical protein
MRVVGPSGPVTLQPLAPGVQTAVDEIFEASIPLALLGVGPGQELEFHLEIGRVRVPAAAELRAVVPASEVADWRL